MHYKIIDDQYVLHDEDNEAIAPPLDTVAIAYASPAASEKKMWTQHRHGDPAIVNDWCAQTQKAFGAIPGLGRIMAGELHVIEGRIDLEDLNIAIKNVGYIQKLVEKAEALDDNPSADRASVMIDGRPIHASVRKKIAP